MKSACPLVLFAFVVVLLVSIACISMAGEPVRGLVVDRDGDILWLGLPAPAAKGAVFDVKLVPGGKVIARAEIIDSTPDAPYVARARFAMEDPTAYIPIGAFVEATPDVITDRGDLLYNFREVRAEPAEARRLSLHVGGFVPSDDALEDETTSVWPAFELKYLIVRSERSEAAIGAGYYQGDGNFEVAGVGGRREVRVFPLTVEVKVRGAGSKCKGGWFARVGAGAYYVNDKRRLGSLTNSDNSVEFGWQAGVGYESMSGRFAQVYFVDVADTDFRGAVLSLGSRF